MNKNNYFAKIIMYSIVHLVRRASWTNNRANLADHGKPSGIIPHPSEVYWEGSSLVCVVLKGGLGYAFFGHA